MVRINGSVWLDMVVELPTFLKIEFARLLNKYAS